PFPRPPTSPPACGGAGAPDAVGAFPPSRSVPLGSRASSYHPFTGQPRPRATSSRDGGSASSPAPLPPTPPTAPAPSPGAHARGGGACVWASWTEVVGSAGSQCPIIILRAAAVDPPSSLPLTEQRFLPGAFRNFLGRGAGWCALDGMTAPDAGLALYQATAWP